MKQNIIMQKQIGAIVIYIHASTRKVCTYMYKIYDVHVPVSFFVAVCCSSMT